MFGFMASRTNDLTDAKLTKINQLSQPFSRFTTAKVIAIDIEDRGIFEVQKMSRILDDRATASGDDARNELNVPQVHDGIASAVNEQGIRTDAFEGNNLAHICNPTAHEAHRNCGLGYPARH